MKRTFLLLFLILSRLAQAQELPSIPSNGFAFPIGSKFSIKLFPIDSTNYNFSIISFEKFDKTVDTYNHDELFEIQGRDSTITFYFCFGTHGETDQEKKKNTLVLLLMKNYSKITLQYLSDIQREQEGKFESTSNVGFFAGATGMEMWPYMIYMIGLRKIQKYQNK